MNNTVKGLMVLLNKSFLLWLKSFFYTHRLLIETFLWVTVPIPSFPSPFSLGQAAAESMVFKAFYYWIPAGACPRASGDGNDDTRKNHRFSAIFRAPRQLLLLAILSFATFLFFPTTVYAADAAITPALQRAVTGSAEGSHVPEESFPKPTVESDISLKSTISEPHGLGVSSEMSKISFLLHEIKVVGSNILTCDELVEPFEELIGKTINLAQAQDIANKMTARIQKEGYILTQVIIPPQRIQNGVLTLQVVGGFIDKIEITGCTIPDLMSLLICYGDKIRSSQPLHNKVLERYLLLANDIPGLSVKAVLTPSKTTPGAGDLKLVTTQKFQQGFAEVNNFGSRFLGPTQYLLSVQINSGYKPGDMTQLFYMTALNRELNYFQLSHSEMWGDEGNRVNIFARYLPTHPGFILKPLNITGKYKVGGIDLLFPVIRSRQENLSVTGSFQVIDNNSKTFGLPIFNDRIRPLLITFLYNHWDDKGVNQIEFSCHQAFRWMNATGVSNISRPNAKSSFTKFVLSLSRDHKLGQDFSFVIQTLSQYSFQPLCSVAQIPLGGPYIGRGYDASELLGDSGITGAVELRYDGPKWDECFKPQYYTFYDAGTLWNHYASSGFLRASATSGGLGLRLQTKANLAINLYFAKPFTKAVSTIGNKHGRYYFSIHYNF